MTIVVEPDSAPPCPVMQRLIRMVARSSQLPGLQERGWLIDQLTDLEAEGIAADAHRRTLDAIRATRLKLRIESLLPMASA
ncbi:hypothetical protein [Methylobacterium sp. 391_Methyba4]|uniref:hypothetical protein n=1 Tax=Methylobacterium sp. 391_Methyba4 TaxID=3038924 RepID=UPI00241EB2F6|nr:hypothetical protein [Methylobacterium sp. 391_Methyba4]WFS08176.1 hypothetical protein P9K36_02425 [Methylobacterium sp. 391_Methyba4]